MTRTTPENPQETARAGSSEAIRQPSRTYEMKRWSTPHGDVGVPVRFMLRTGRSEIPCRVERNLPLERAISPATPANNGETLLGDERAIPWEVESGKLFDPVTTEVARPRWSSLSQGKSMNSIRRRPLEHSRIDLPSYIVGYVDGEGCFCISMRPQKRIQIGWEVRPSFSVSQNDDRAELVRLMPHLFGCGSIRPDRSDRTVKYEVRSLKHLLATVIPFFEAYPLMSAKRNDFEVFARVCRMMELGLHLQREGILEIADLASQMNSSGIRKYTAEMVRSAVLR
jgi:LAGLIDADG endonuclease